MKTAEPVPPEYEEEQEQRQAVVVTLYANERIPVYAQLVEFPPPPSFSWCFMFVLRLYLSFVLISIVFSVPLFIILLLTGVIR